MAFYESIAPWYDDIFPYDEEEIAFLSSVFSRYSRPSGDRKLLDLGCGTGTVLSAFSGAFDKLVGVDLDPELLKLAAAKLLPRQADKAELLNGSILNLENLLDGEQFGCISCLGNTLPHLTGTGEIAAFFASVHRHLADAGVFVFQTVNFDRVLDFDLRGLPTIERGSLSFERYYSAPDRDGLIAFDTTLTVPESGAEIRNSIRLRPVRKAQYDEYLRSAGFSKRTFFGDYAGGEFTIDSFLLIGVCGK